MASAGLTLPAVIAARAMVGLGEGVALPSMNNLVGTRIAKANRSTALGASFSGFHSGAPPPPLRPLAPQVEVCSIFACSALLLEYLC